MLNQVSLTGRVSQIEKGEDKTAILLRIFRFDDDKSECIPVVINSDTRNRIGYLRRGDLIGITGRLKFENDSVKVIADRISYVG